MLTKRSLILILTLTALLSGVVAFAGDDFVIPGSPLYVINAQLDDEAVKIAIVKEAEETKVVIFDADEVLEQAEVELEFVGEINMNHELGWGAQFLVWDASNNIWHFDGVELVAGYSGTVLHDQLRQTVEGTWSLPPCTRVEDDPTCVGDVATTTFYYGESTAQLNHFGPIAYHEPSGESLSFYGHSIETFAEAIYAGDRVTVSGVCDKVEDFIHWFFLDEEANLGIAASCTQTIEGPTLVDEFVNIIPGDQYLMWDSVKSDTFFPEFLEGELTSSAYSAEPPLQAVMRNARPQLLDAGKRFYNNPEGIVIILLESEDGKSEAWQYVTDEVAAEGGIDQWLRLPINNGCEPVQILHWAGEYICVVEGGFTIEPIFQG